MVSRPKDSATTRACQTASENSFALPELKFSCCIMSSNVVGRKIRVIGVPLDLGQSRRGVDMGPSAMRVAGLEARLEELGHVVEDAGNVSVAMPEQKKEGDPQAKYLK